MHNKNGGGYKNGGGLMLPYSNPIYPKKYSKII